MQQKRSQHPKATHKKTSLVHCQHLHSCRFLYPASTPRDSFSNPIPHRNTGFSLTHLPTAAHHFSREIRDSLSMYTLHPHSYKTRTKGWRNNRIIESYGWKWPWRFSIPQGRNLHTIPPPIAVQLLFRNLQE